MDSTGSNPLCTLCANSAYLYRGSTFVHRHNLISHTPSHFSRPPCNPTPHTACVRTCPANTTPQGTLSIGRFCQDATGSPPPPSYPQQYEVRPPTATTARQCANVSSCDPARQWQAAEPTATSDRDCRLLTVCGAEQYLSQPSDGYADNRCSNATRCQLGATYELQALTATSDRRCTPVSPSACRASCNSGSAVPGGGGACSCADHCAACVGPAGSPNTACWRCQSGFALDIATGACVSNCGTGTVSSDTGATFGRVCYTTTVNATRVLTLLPDLRPQYQSAAPTLTSNRQCTAIRSCNTSSEYQVAAPTATSDRICATVRSCATSEYIGINATATSDVTCR